MSVDLGTGDGNAVLRAARAEPAWLHVGIDAVAEGMTAASGRAHRERLENALFVRAAAEALPPELAGCAARMTVVLPWRSLLRIVAAPDAEALAGIRRLCGPGALFRAVVAYSPERDARTWRELGLEPGVVDERSLAKGYASAGFTLLGVRDCTKQEFAALGTAWARRLARSPGRMAWVLTAIAAEAHSMKA